MYYDQSNYQLRFEWGLEGLNALSPMVEAVVIVDVLSFSTCVDVSCSRGAMVYPFRWKDERAQAFAEERDAMLAVSRSQKTDTGYSLSPVSLDQVRPGERIVLPSPNGSLLSFESKAKRTFCGCLRNASKLAEHLNTLSGPKLVIAAGERWADDSLRPALEDLVGAGGILGALSGSSSPEAKSAIEVFEQNKADGFSELGRCSSARELVGKGFSEDVEMSFDYDSSDAVIELENGSFSSGGFAG